MKALVNVRPVLEDRVAELSTVYFDTCIQAIRPAGEASDLSGVEVLDGGGAYLSPGLIDLHIHGLDGVDVMDGTRTALARMAERLPETGVTSFLPTTMTMPHPDIEAAIRSVRDWMRSPGPGARVLGVHLEGPFISPRYKGAQDPTHIRKPDFKSIEPWLDVIRLITLAPELEGTEAFIRQVRGASDTVLSIGHSEATYEEALEAFRWGVTHITHCFNAMSPMHHRAPGVVGAALAWPFTTELICDDIHVDPGFYQGFLNIKGLDRVVPVTDCMRAGCLPEGTYTLGGQAVTVRDGACRLADGTLAGSTLKLNEALRNLQRQTTLQLQELIALATRNPVRILGLEAELGSLEPGKRADCFLHDEAFTVFQTVCGGETTYQKERGNA